MMCTHKKRKHLEWIDCWIYGNKEGRKKLEPFYHEEVDELVRIYFLWSVWLGT